MFSEEFLQRVATDSLAGALIEFVVEIEVSVSITMQWDDVVFGPVWVSSHPRQRWHSAFVFARVILLTCW